MKRCASCRWFSRMPGTKYGECRSVGHRGPPETWLKVDATTYDTLWVTQEFGCVLWQKGGGDGPRILDRLDIGVELEDSHL